MMRPFLIQINKPETFHKEMLLFKGRLKHLVIEGICIHFDFEELVRLRYRLSKGKMRIYVCSKNNTIAAFNAEVYKGLLVTEGINNDDYNAFCFSEEEGLAFVSYCLSLYRNNEGICRCNYTQAYRCKNEIRVYYDDDNNVDTGFYVTEIEDAQFSKECWEYFKIKNAKRRYFFSHN